MRSVPRWPSHHDAAGLGMRDRRDTSTVWTWQRHTSLRLIVLLREKRSQSLDRLKRMTASAQLERREMRKLVAERSPSRLAGAIGLIERQPGAQVSFRQGRKERAAAGALRR